MYEAHHQFTYFTRLFFLILTEGRPSYPIDHAAEVAIHGVNPRQT